MKRIMWIILQGFAIGVLFAMMQWPFWMAIVLFAIITVAEMLVMLHALYFSQNLKRITKYIDRQKKNPLYAYMHLLRDGTNAELIDALDRVLAQYKQTKVQAVYGANKAIMQEDFGTARRLAEPISSTEIGQYTLALIEAMQGNREEAERYSLTKEWMKAGIEANLAFVEKDRVAFEREAQNAIDGAKGGQYYSNTYVFKRMRDGWE
ncbi:MAG: hypothetical protein ACI33P_00515 [Lysinibacillus sp.]